MILEIGEMLQNFLAISGDELLQMKANELKAETGTEKKIEIKSLEEEEKWRSRL